MKTCARCDKAQPLTEYTKRKDGRWYPYCRTCNRELCRLSRERAKYVLPLWRPDPLNVAFNQWLQQ